jgi:hypothetical protein
VVEASGQKVPTNLILALMAEVAVVLVVYLLASLPRARGAVAEAALRQLRRGMAYMPAMAVLAARLGAG